MLCRRCCTSRWHKLGSQHTRQVQTTCSCCACQMDNRRRIYTRRDAIIHNLHAKIQVNTSRTVRRRKELMDLFFRKYCNSFRRTRQLGNLCKFLAANGWRFRGIDLLNILDMYGIMMIHNRRGSDDTSLYLPDCPCTVHSCCTGRRQNCRSLLCTGRVGIQSMANTCLHRQHCN